jgi:DNA polymerase III gamma/tau subunit
LNRGIEDGADPLEMYRGLVDYMRVALLVHNQLPNELLDLSDEEIEKIKSMDLDREKAMSMLDVLLKSEELIKR